MSPVLLFDLDDTLYPEAGYVRSGHRIIAQAIADRTGDDNATVFSAIRYDYCKFGRAGLFDRIVAKYNLPAGLTAELVQIYRQHKPDISLDADVAGLLGTLRKTYKTAIVTDGEVNMQRAKVEALGLNEVVDLVVYCWELDAKKPDPDAFVHAVQQLGGSKGSAIIIGDDPTHDVEAACRMGAACVRVRANRFSEIESLVRPPEYREIMSILDCSAAIRSIESQWH